MNWTSIFFVVSAFLIAFVSATANPPVAGATLEKVLVYFRHGKRTTLFPYPIEPEWSCRSTYVTYHSDLIDGEPQIPRRLLQLKPRSDFNKLPGDCLTGQLTDAGYEMHREIGSRLYQRYGPDGFGILPEVPHKSNVYLYTTNLERTQSSLEAELETLFPYAYPAVFTVETAEKDTDPAIPPSKVCPALTQTEKRLSDELDRGMTAEDRTITRKICESVGMPNCVDPLTKKRYDMFQMADNMLSKEAQGIPLEPLVAKYRETIIEFYNKRMRHFMADEKYTALAAGRFLKLNVVDQLINERSVPFQIYSVHDVTVAPLYHVLGKRIQVWPEFAENIQLELWRSPSGERLVQMIHNGEVVEIEDCGGRSVCPLTEFIRMKTYTKTWSLTQRLYRSYCPGYEDQLE